MLWKTPLLKLTVSTNFQHGHQNNKKAKDIPNVMTICIIILLNKEVRRIGNTDRIEL